MSTIAQLKKYVTGKYPYILLISDSMSERNYFGHTATSALNILYTKAILELSQSQIQPKTEKKNYFKCLINGKQQFLSFQ